MTSNKKKLDTSYGILNVIDNVSLTTPYGQSTYTQDYLRWCNGISTECKMTKKELDNIPQWKKDIALKIFPQNRKH